MKLIIMGCGRVGARLAMLMQSEGHDVTIIDADPSSFNRLPETFIGQTVLGTGIDVDVLKSAGIESADAFAAVTNFDNTNIMASQVAREIFGVRKVLARIYDPGRETLYHELGLETVCPTTLVSTTARDILSDTAPKQLADDLVRDIHAATTEQTIAAMLQPVSSPSNPPTSPLRPVDESQEPVGLAALADVTERSGPGPRVVRPIQTPSLPVQPPPSSGEDKHGADDAKSGRGLRNLFRP